LTGSRGADSPRRALVTGASSGIGRAIALALGRAGWDLILLGRRAEALAETARVAGEEGGRTIDVRVVDLERAPDVEELAATLATTYVRLDVLVHAAGVHLLAPLEATGTSDLDRLYAVNVRAPVTLTRLLLPLLDEGQGDVVFINSSVVFHPRARVAAYAASKHALRGIADTLRAEVNPLGIRVLTVYPGRTATPTQAEIHELDGIPYRPERLLQPEDVAAAVCSAIFLSRTAEVTEIFIRPFLP
jgi:NAD(P)-dependent dehydrogenase (short-subunit alcohol dehydrogenase family)